MEDVRRSITPSSELKGLDTEYRYIVHIRAQETFANLMRREGIVIAEGPGHASFASTVRLPLREYKEDGLIWSYSIIRVRRDEEVIEEG
jgi:hypothetical protein